MITIGNSCHTKSAILLFMYLPDIHMVVSSLVMDANHWSGEMVLMYETIHSAELKMEPTLLQWQKIEKPSHVADRLMINEVLDMI